MGRPSRFETHLAKFPRLREIRERQLGWDVIELVTKLQNRPSIATIYRLEHGDGVRPSTARRVFDVINAALGNQLEYGREIVFEARGTPGRAESMPLKPVLRREA